MQLSGSITLLGVCPFSVQANWLKKKEKKKTEEGTKTTKHWEVAQTCLFQQDAALF